MFFGGVGGKWGGGGVRVDVNEEVKFFFGGGGWGGGGRARGGVQIRGGVGEGGSKVWGRWVM